MPLTSLPLDTRGYQDLLNEALARIPVHTPEWTNFNPSDPGVTLIEVFAFLTENLLYRCNQVPERNRRKFLQLLGVPLSPAASACGLVTILNERGVLETKTLNGGLEVQAGPVPFRTDRGLDVLPVEARAYSKRKLEDPTGELGKHYNLLYASLKQEAVEAETELTIYETVAFGGQDGRGLSLGDDTVDGCLWLALLVRASDKPVDDTTAGKEKLRDRVRDAIANKTLTLGIVPALESVERRLAPAGAPEVGSRALLLFQVPKLPAGGKLPTEPQLRTAEYRPLEAKPSADVLAEPGIVELTLPGADELRLWTDLDPLEPGAGDFPPALEDSNLNDRLVTWIRISSIGAVKARLLWVGINTVPVTQRDHIANEALADGSGETDQSRTLADPPVLPGSVRVVVSNAKGDWDRWDEVGDLFAAGPEVRVAQARQAPGSPPPDQRKAEVFSVNAESGEIRFGDGFRGKRPPAGARLRASYDHSRGDAGNVGRGAINTGPALPAGFTVTNPIRTWGGAAAEPVAEGERQIPRYLQHRDRLVTTADFESIALRTPGLDIGRVEVLPAFNPDLSPDAPGNAPGAVTLMLVPRYDPKHPDTPEPDRLFINAVCRHLDPRRLVTTELLLRGPDYKAIWITAGIEVLATGRSPAEVREEVKRRLLEYLAPLRETGLPDPEAALTTPEYADMRKGWPLRKAVSARELMAVASRVPGVRQVNKVRLADSEGREMDDVPMERLQLPRVAGIAVAQGDAPAPADLRGGAPADLRGGAPAAPDGKKRIVPVPVIPEEC